MTNELITKITDILYDKKAQNIIALDVHDLTVITDCMIIANGRSALQVKALADDLEEKLSEEGIEPTRTEGHQDGRWIVLDYGSVLVHLFHPEEREFYRLDKLWENDQNRIALAFDAVQDED
ncbi:MAG: ribosome silencing factor [Clostridiales bacterium]|nr:ribosome silencing factor [Clostridiales bacterium]